MALRTSRHHWRSSRAVRSLFLSCGDLQPPSGKRGGCAGLRVQAELSVAYAQLGRDDDAIRALGLAEEGYPDDPQDDPSYLHAEFTPASLALDQGMAYLALAERHAGRGYPQKAAEVLTMIDRPASLAAPDRVRFEIANHQARAAVLLDDLDAFELHIRRGIDGAEILMAAGSASGKRTPPGGRPHSACKCRAETTTNSPPRHYLADIMAIRKHRCQPLAPGEVTGLEGSAHP